MHEPGQVQARLVGSGKQAPLGKLTESMAGHLEIPWLPAASGTEIRNRPSTKDWLDKVVKRMKEERAWSDEVRDGILAMVAPGCVLREVFEYYIARIGEEDALEMALEMAAIGEDDAAKLTEEQETIQKRFNDYDGSLWIHIQEEQLTEVQLLILLYQFWDEYHPFVLSERTETQKIYMIKHKIEEEVSQIAHQRLSEAMALGSLNIADELPARVPRKEDPEVISSGSGDESWEGGFDTATE